MKKCDLCGKELGRHIFKIVEEERYDDKSTKFSHTVFQYHMGCFNEWVDKHNVRKK